ncbi:hypothetical protein BaRGS_00034163, partial [Batillaria attramentaria]
MTSSRTPPKTLCLGTTYSATPLTFFAEDLSYPQAQKSSFFPLEFAPLRSAENRHYKYLRRRAKLSNAIFDYKK